MTQLPIRLTIKFSHLTGLKIAHTPFSEPSNLYIQMRYEDITVVEQWQLPFDSGLCKIIEKLTVYFVYGTYHSIVT